MAKFPCKFLFMFSKLRAKVLRTKDIFEEIDENKNHKNEIVNPPIDFEIKDRIFVTKWFGFELKILQKLYDIIIFKNKEGLSQNVILQLDKAVAKLGLDKNRDIYFHVTR